MFEHHQRDDFACLGAAHLTNYWRRAFFFSGQGDIGYPALLPACQHIEDSAFVGIAPTVGPVAHLGGVGQIGQQQGVVWAGELVAQAQHRFERAEIAFRTVGQKTALRRGSGRTGQRGIGQYLHTGVVNIGHFFGNIGEQCQRIGHAYWHMVNFAETDCAAAVAAARVVVGGDPNGGFWNKHRRHQHNHQEVVARLHGAAGNKLSQHRTQGEHRTQYQ